MTVSLAKDLDLIARIEEARSRPLASFHRDYRTVSRDGRVNLVLIDGGRHGTVLVQHSAVTS